MLKRKRMRMRMRKGTRPHAGQQPVPLPCSSFRPHYWKAGSSLTAFPVLGPSPLLDGGLLCPVLRIVPEHHAHERPQRVGAQVTPLIA